MSKIYLSFSFIFCLSMMAFGQRFEGGFTGGLVASQVDGDTYAGYNKLGVSLGAFVSTPLNQKSDIQFEIKYITKGANKKVTETDPRMYTSQLNYIEFPLIFKYKSSEKIAWELGAAGGYLYSFSEKDENGPLNTTGSAKFKPFELSAILGFKYSFSKHLGVNIRFSYSILPIMDFGQTTAYYFKSGAYNNLFNFNLYYTVFN